MEIIGDIWNEAIIRPMINSLVMLYWLFFSNFGLSIIVFTVIVRAALIPLTIKQSRQMKAMSELQPAMKEIQQKYKDDRQRASQETMKLYRDRGVNPIGCLGPMVIQMPVFLGLFWALRGTLPSTPERLADLSQHLYSWLPPVHQAVPLDGSFLGLDLAAYASENPIPFLLPVMVGGSMWLMQKMTTTPATSPQQESTQRMMLWMLPLMFGFFTLSFESGLALYWIISNLIGIVIQGFVVGWGPIAQFLPFLQQQQPVTVEPKAQEAETLQEAESPPEEGPSEEHRDNGKNSGGSNRARSKGARRRTQRRRNRRH